MVSALYSGSRVPGSSPGRVIVLCSWARHFTLTVPLSTQEYKWVPAKCWGVTCDGLATHPGGIAIFLGPVVRKEVSANPGLKVKLGFDFS